MNRLRALLTRSLMVLLAGCWATSAQAVLLSPGSGSVPLPGTTVAAEPQLAGTVIVDELIDFSFSAGIGLGDITGTVQQRIVRSSLDNTLDFYWRVMNDATSAGAIGSFRIGDFVAPEYNANWRIDGVGDLGPDSAVRFASPLDTYINFNFDVFSTDPADGLLPGLSSNFMFLDTTATAFAKTAKFDLTNMQQNPISASFAAYSPVQVPVPASIWLFAFGLIILLRHGFEIRQT